MTYRLTCILLVAVSAAAAAQAPTEHGQLTLARVWQSGTDTTAYARAWAMYDNNTSQTLQLVRFECTATDADGRVLFDNTFRYPHWGWNVVMPPGYLAPVEVVARLQPGEAMDAMHCDILDVVVAPAEREVPRNGELRVERMGQTSRFAKASATYWNDTPHTFRSVEIQCVAMDADRNLLEVGKWIIPGWGEDYLVEPGFRTRGDVVVTLEPGEQMDSMSCGILQTREPKGGAGGGG